MRCLGVTVSPTEKGLGRSWVCRIWELQAVCCATIRSCPAMKAE